MRPRLSPATTRGYHSGRKPANAGNAYPAEILSPREVSALLRACSATSATGIRNRALIVALYRGGLRVGEALALHPKDFDPQAGTIAILHGKGNKRRTVGIDAEATAVIQNWLEARRTLGLHRRRSTLFCTLRGAPLKSSYVRTLLPRLAGNAGIEKRVHPHGLRHTHAAELAAEGFPVNLIQAQLGHASLATTDRYLRHIAPVELIAAIQRRSWSH